MRCIDYTEQRWIFPSELGNSRSEWNRWDVHPNYIETSFMPFKNCLVRGLFFALLIASKSRRVMSAVRHGDLPKQTCTEHFISPKSRQLKVHTR